MLSRKPKTPVVISAGPKRSPSTSNPAPALLTPPLRPTDSAKSHYPDFQAEYPSYPPYSSPSNPRSYRFADEYDAYQRSRYAMSQSSSRSNSPQSSGNQPLNQPPTSTLVRDPHISGGRKGGPKLNYHGYEAVSRGNIVVHNHGAGYRDFDRPPPEQRERHYENPSVRR